jgi:glucose-6-phosphate-specific signal transduction histidine kinase
MTGIVEKTAVKNLAERMYAELNEILAKDLGAQRELSEKFKDSDDALRTQLERIEASAAGLSSDGTSYRDAKSGRRASEAQVDSLEQSIDQAMLRQNPDVERALLQYRGNKFEILELQKIKAAIDANPRLGRKR